MKRIFRESELTTTYQGKNKVKCDNLYDHFHNETWLANYFSHRYARLPRWYHSSRYTYYIILCKDNEEDLYVMFDTKESAKRFCEEWSSNLHIDSVFCDTVAAKKKLYDMLKNHEI